MDEYYKLAEKLDILPCPHCRITGCLNRHGISKRYDEKTCTQTNSGARVFCNNRGNMDGCGRTYPVVLVERMYQYIVSCATLWGFLLLLMNGGFIKDCWETATSAFCLDTGYKLRTAFIRSQPHIRTLLNQLGPPANISAIKDPLLQTISHMQSAFGSSDCPVSAFQLRFQKPFLV